MGVSVADRLGLIAAVRYALALGLDAIEAAVGTGRNRLRAGLATVPGVTVRDLGERQCGIVTFTVERRTVAGAGTLKPAVRRGVTVATGVAAWAPTWIDMTRAGLDEVVRASPHYFVSPERDRSGGRDRISRLTPMTRGFTQSA